MKNLHVGPFLGGLDYYTDTESHCDSATDSGSDTDTDDECESELVFTPHIDFQSLKDCPELMKEILSRGTFTESHYQNICLQYCNTLEILQ